LRRRRLQAEPRRDPLRPRLSRTVLGRLLHRPHGPHTADAALLFDALAGPSPRDPSSRIALDPAEDPETLRIAFAPRLGLDVAIDAEAEEAVAWRRRRV
jgi:aspartyl-tRNA(Asn)/glutamyl-tRNA(Gln) amidotransferase subunit A